MQALVWYKACLARELLNNTAFWTFEHSGRESSPHEWYAGRRGGMDRIRMEDVNAFGSVP